MNAQTISEPVTPVAHLSTLNSTDFQITLSDSRALHTTDELFAAVLTAVEEALTKHPHVKSIELAESPASSLGQRLIYEGLAVRSAERLEMPPELIWQQPRFWMNGPTSNGYPLTYKLSDGRRHPMRPAKPVGTVYSRFIPWLDSTFSLRTVDIDRDLERFHRWQNDPRVAHFWQEDGDLAKHRQYLEGVAADPHMISLLGCFADQPFAYLEAYWAKEDRIAPFYEAQDHDRGWHALVGEEAFLGREYVAAWIPSYMHYLFLDDSRTQRIVGEPRHDNQKIIANLDRNGFAKIKHFDFPHKRALLVMLTRERFFGDRLLSPQWGTR
jgi:RimJ/RimL family protein N-acetyltransferase